MDERPPDGEGRDVVQVEVDERVAVMTLNRPDQRNALSRALLRRITDVVAELEDDAGVDVVILTGADPAFCAGVDLKEPWSVARPELLPFCRRLAADIVSNDQAGVRQMLDTYRRGSGTTANEAWDLEADVSRAWADAHLDPAAVEARRLAIVERGRAQQR